MANFQVKFVKFFRALLEKCSSNKISFSHLEMRNIAEVKRNEKG